MQRKTRILSFTLLIALVSLICNAQGSNSQPAKLRVYPLEFLGRPDHSTVVAWFNPLDGEQGDVLAAMQVNSSVPTVNIDNVANMTDVRCEGNIVNVTFSTPIDSLLTWKTEPTLLIVGARHKCGPGGVANMSFLLATEWVIDTDSYTVEFTTIEPHAGNVEATYQIIAMPQVAGQITQVNTPNGSPPQSLTKRRKLTKNNRRSVWSKLKHSVEKSNDKIKHSIEKSNHEIKEAFEDAGHDIKKGFDKAGHEIKKGIHKMEESLDEAGRKMKEGMEHFAEDVEKGAEKLGHEIEDAMVHVVKPKLKAVGRKILTAFHDVKKFLEAKFDFSISIPLHMDLCFDQYFNISLTDTIQTDILCRPCRLKSKSTVTIHVKGQLFTKHADFSISWEGYLNSTSLLWIGESILVSKPILSRDLMHIDITPLEIPGIIGIGPILSIQIKAKAFGDVFVGFWVGYSFEMTDFKAFASSTGEHYAHGFNPKKQGFFNTTIMSEMVMMFDLVPRLGLGIEIFGFEFDALSIYLDAQIEAGVYDIMSYNPLSGDDLLAINFRVWHISRFVAQYGKINRVLASTPYEILYKRLYYFKNSTSDHMTEHDRVWTPGKSNNNQTLQEALTFTYNKCWQQHFVP